MYPSVYLHSEAVNNSHPLEVFAELYSDCI